MTKLRLRKLDLGPSARKQPNWDFSPNFWCKHCAFFLLYTRMLPAKHFRFNLAPAPQIGSCLPKDQVVSPASMKPAQVRASNWWHFRHFYFHFFFFTFKEDFVHVPALLLIGFLEFRVVGMWGGDLDLKIFFLFFLFSPFSLPSQ